MKKNIGENILKLRKLNGMTQKYLAAKIGISSQGLLKIEKGITSPNARTLGKIVDVLCVTPNQLFGLEAITEDNGSLIERLKKLK